MGGKKRSLNLHFFPCFYCQIMRSIEIKKGKMVFAKLKKFFAELIFSRQIFFFAQKDFFFPVLATGGKVRLRLG
jgi:hypothetical protein